MTNFRMKQNRVSLVLFMTGTNSLTLKKTTVTSIIKFYYYVRPESRLKTQSDRSVGQNELLKYKPFFVYKGLLHLVNNYISKVFN